MHLTYLAPLFGWGPILVFPIHSLMLREYVHFFSHVQNIRDPILAVLMIFFVNFGYLHYGHKCLSAVKSTNQIYFYNGL